MQTGIINIELAIFLFSIISALLGAFIILIFLTYRKRKNKYIQEKIELIQEFEKQTLQSQLEIQEQTFNIISQEIHDNVGQILSLAKVQMNILEEQLVNPPAILKDTKENISRAMNDLRDIAKGLSTERIEQFDILQALQHEVDRLNKTKANLCSINVIGAVQKIDSKKKLIVFRIVQEALNNVLKHAYASKINLALVFQETELAIQIIDNGKGFNLTDENHTGLGLQNIIKRASLIGGNASIESEINNGTTINLNIPYE
ncbi:MAG: hypothetical protein C0459_00415 [Chitinophaga sp.]|jgi:two-component system NarL family sensor kinase|nr:hypothetical protein [Chitinophaga sp.]